MPTKCFWAIVLPFLVIGPLAAQLNELSDIEEAHSEFFDPVRENFHLHLNKTSYIPGESIWFKAYVMEQNSQLPSSESASLHVALYDQKGQEIKRKLIYLENGTGHGQFKLDSVMVDSVYYLKAYTNWMKNFSNENSFVEKVFLKRSASSRYQKQGRDIDVGLYPETGHILADANNTVVFKLGGMNPISEVNSVRLNDPSGEVIISDIEYSSSGYGKFRYQQVGKDAFSMLVELKNGETLEKKLPVPEADGISWSINNLAGTGPIVEFATNRSTLSNQISDIYYLAIHKNDYLKVQPIRLKDTLQMLRIPQQDLKPGINTVTLFNSEYRPMARRLIFQRPKTQQAQIRTLNVSEVEGDSVQVSMKIEHPDITQYSLSISALPAAQSSYSPTNSILSSYWLMPYISKPVRSPAGLFEDWDRSTSYELDLFLIAEGWGSYNWDLIFQNPTTNDYQWESGIEISGQVFDSKGMDENRVWMYTEKTEDMIFGELQGDKSFQTLSRLYRGDSLNLSVSNIKGKLRKPKAKVSFGPEISSASLSLNERNQIVDWGFVDEDSENYNLQDSATQFPMILPENTIELEEVQLVQKKKVENRMINPFAVAADAEARIISDEDIEVRKTLNRYLTRLGFRVSVRNNEVVIVPRIPDPRISTVAVILDGVPVDGSEILNMPLSRVHSLTYDARRSEFISINTRFENYQQKRDEFIRFLITNGYDRPQEYQKPIYSYADLTAFELYGMIDWNPEITATSNAPFTYTFSKGRLENFTLFIEGMGSDGTLISTSQTLKLD